MTGVVQGRLDKAVQLIGFDLDGDADDVDGRSPVVGERVGFWLIFLNHGKGRQIVAGIPSAETTTIVRFRFATAYHRSNAYGPCGLSVFRRQSPQTPKNLATNLPNTPVGRKEMGKLHFSFPP